MGRDTLISARGAKPIGPYSHAVWAGSLLFCSGQGPINPATGKLVEGGVTVQTQQVFDNLEGILTDAGLSMDDVVKVNVFLTSMDDFAAMNAVYKTRFNSPYPARSCVAVADLPLHILVEIELVACRPSIE